MPVIKLLLEDHQKITKCMEDIAVSMIDLSFDVANMRALFDRFIKLLSMHHLAEDTLLYEAIKDSAYLKDRVLKSQEAHHLVMQGLTQLELFKHKNMVWNAKFMVIREMVLMQIKEEENEIFPVANEIMSPHMKEALAKKIREQRVNSIIILH